MARGKYKSAAEARRVREEAISEAEAGRRAIVKLSAENKELRETLAAEREANTARLRELNALLAEGAAPEVEALRRELALARKDADSAVRIVARQIVQVFRRPDFTATVEFYAELSQALGVSPAEFWKGESELTREERRATPKTVRANANLNGWAKANGVPL